MSIAEIINNPPPIVWGGIALLIGLVVVSQLAQALGVFAKMALGALAVAAIVPIAFEVVPSDQTKQGVLAFKQNIEENADLSTIHGDGTVEGLVPEETRPAIEATQEKIKDFLNI